MRRLRIAAPVQLALEGIDDPSTGGWAMLPEAARQQTLVLLARLIAKGVLADGEDGDGG